jgi:hypothetical protein
LNFNKEIPYFCELKEEEIIKADEKMLPPDDLIIDRKKRKLKQALKRGI